MAKEAGDNGARRRRASRYDQVEQAAVGYCYGDSTAGQRALYELGLTRHPRRQRQQQLLDRILGALPGQAASSRAASPTARWRSASRRWRRARSASSTSTAPMPMDKHARGDDRASAASTQAPPAPQMFGNAGREYMERYGVKAESVRPHRARRTTATRPTTRTRSSATSTRSRRSWRRRWCTSRSRSCSAAPPPTVARPRSLASEDVRARARPRGPGGRDHRHGDDHRLPVDASTSSSDMKLRRLRHDARRRPRRSTSSPATAPRRST